MKATRDHTKARLAAWITAGGLLLCPAVSRGGDLAAVLSSNSGPYAEAYAAFKAELGLPVDLYDLSKTGTEAPQEQVYAAVFGAKAAALGYPAGSHIVYALTPVTIRSRLWNEISMVPAPEPAIAAYKGLQPGLKRLAVFWTAYPGEQYLSDLKEAGKKAGIEVISSKLKSPDSFPDRLRRLMGSMDAFWLMPDPALITQSSIMVLASFSCDNSIPFYAPTSALVTSGATASYAPEFQEAGAAAARILLQMRNGTRVQQVTYVNKVSLRVNADAAEKCRWPINRK